MIQKFLSQLLRCNDIPLAFCLMAMFLKCTQKKKNRNKSYGRSYSVQDLADLRLP